MTETVYYHPTVPGMSYSITRYERGELLRVTVAVGLRAIDSAIRGAIARLGTV